MNSILLLSPGAVCDIFDSVSNVANDFGSGIDTFFSNTNERFEAWKNPFDISFGESSSNSIPNSCPKNEFSSIAEITESTAQTVTCLEETSGQLVLKIATPYKTKTVPLRGLDSEETDFEKKRDILMQSDKKLYKTNEVEGKRRKGRSLMAVMDNALESTIDYSLGDKFSSFFFFYN